MRDRNVGVKFFALFFESEVATLLAKYEHTRFITYLNFPVDG